MEIYNWVIQNKEMFKIFYGLIIALICFVIVLKTNRLFKLSFHQGIRYFRNAFFFYGIAFLFRYIFGALAFYGYITYQFWIKMLFEFFLVMGGFFLLYSLLWKKIEPEHKPFYSSLLNFNIVIFYLMAIVIVVLDYLWKSYSFMFISQIILFICMSIVTGIKIKKDKGKHKFLKFYFTAIILILVAWILNSALQFFAWSKGVLIDIYIINIIFFLLFLYSVIKITSK
ncbi:MAG: hypothetical protein Q8P15_00990 [Nanoarchaeota archaeon]|nr:hypothetical protein [Nanoarchaeota archaeon]